MVLESIVTKVCWVYCVTYYQTTNEHLFPCSRYLLLYV